MTTIQKFAAVTAIAAAVSGHAALPVRAGDAAIPAKVLGPLKAATFDIGQKRALTYYEATKDACKVSVLVTDSFDETKGTYPTSVRFNSVVSGGETAQVDTAAGPSLVVSCAPGAKTLMVRTIERVAYAAPKKN